MEANKMVHTIEYNGRELVRIYENPNYSWGYSYTLLVEGHGVHHGISPHRLTLVLARAEKKGGTVYSW